MPTAAQALPRPRSRTPYTLLAGRAPVREVYFVKHIDNSRIVREVDGTKRRECYAVVGLVAVAFALLFAYAWQHFQCVRYGYLIEQLRQQKHALAEGNRGLRLQEASLEDPQVIDVEARTELGLREPDPTQVLRAEEPQGEPQFAESKPESDTIWARLGRLARPDTKGQSGP
jgi:cell division protein FtsL